MLDGHMEIFCFFKQESFQKRESKSYFSQANIKPGKTYYNIARARLLNRSPVPSYGSEKQ